MTASNNAWDEEADRSPKDAIEQRLAQFDSGILARFIAQLYEEFPALHSRIDILCLHEDPAALEAALKKRVQSVRRGRRFVAYGDSFQMAHELQGLLSDIRELLLPRAPAAAFRLIDAFLQTDQRVMGRVDDSSGAIGDVYHNLCLAWLEAAATSPVTEDWSERIYQLHQGNDYGTRDALLPNAAILLSPDELRGLAARYEARCADKPETGAASDDWDGFRACVALGQVARALRDPALYERSITLYSPEPNPLQAATIAGHYLEYGQAEAALVWLGTPWGQHETQRLALLDQAYSALGDQTKLREVRRASYKMARDFSALQRLLEVLPEREHQTVVSHAAEEAATQGDVISAVDLLLQLQLPERAQEVLLDRRAQLAGCLYNRLLDLGKRLEQSACVLAAVVCYRYLLDDILSAARSKAYKHAGRYYRRLAALDEQLNDYGPVPGHDVYVAGLRERHGRKRSFWSCAERA